MLHTGSLCWLRGSQQGAVVAANDVAWLLVYLRTVCDLSRRGRHRASVCDLSRRLRRRAPVMRVSLRA